MLTKEECREALEHIKTLRGSNYGGYYSGFNNSALPFDEDINVMQELIHEHFDNPPLTLDELYEFVKQDTDYHYLPVWDNKFGGQWFVLENINGNKLKFKGYDHPIEFEEGRYYRKEVQECN